uniref:Putative secreted protein n=1 Tax=Ixodes ricinus TaxID=34613 RepID=V5GX43_IXORI
MNPVPMSAFFAVLGLSILALVSTSTPTQRKYEELQSNPVLLFQCYRNGTTPDRELSVNYTSLFDGTEPGNDNATVTLWFAINGTEDQVYKFTFDASYVPETDGITFAYGGRDELRSVLTEDPTQRHCLRNKRNIQRHGVSSDLPDGRVVRNGTCGTPATVPGWLRHEADKDIFEG